MLLNSFIEESESALAFLYPKQEAHSMVMILCEERLGIKSYTHIVEPLREIPDESAAALHEDIARLSAGEPLQYVLGYAPFCGKNFNVTPSVLIPRPETEILAQESIKVGARLQRMRFAYGKSAKPVKILDLCTGSGCLAWTLAMSIPGAEVTAVDISQEALDVASAQPFAADAAKNVFKSPTFVRADILDPGCDFGQFDMIVANPPYIRNSEKPRMRKNVLDYEPEIALFVSDDDPFIFCRAIAQIAVKSLQDGGKGFVEINEELGELSQQAFIAAGLKEVALIKDYFGKNRFVAFVKK